MRKVLRFIRKEFLQLRRDPRLLPIVFVAPVVQLLLLGFAVDLDVRDIPTVVCDRDGTASSRDLLSRFFNSGYFSVAGRVDATRDIDPYLVGGTAVMAIVVPRGFGDDMARGAKAKVQVLVDGTESQSATIGVGYVALVVSRASRELLEPALARLRDLGLRPARIEPEVRVWYNPTLRSRNFMVPGVLGLVLMVMTMMLTSMAIVREKELGTMEQLVVTPIRPVELIAGKLLPFLLIGVVDVVLVVAVARFVFRVPLQGSPGLLLAMSLVFMLTTLGLGLFISTISENQQQAMLTAVFLIMPMMMLSGFVFPIENMPRVVQWATYLVPLRYYFVVIRAVFLKGAGLAELWPQGLAMLAFGAAILALSVLRFRKQSG